jgi:hypothetical protein
MSWSPQANSQMEFVKNAAGATSAEMGRLISDMSDWASNNQNGPRHFIPFGRQRDCGVSFTVTNGEITDVHYGDND